ncbi:DUF4397 domain-containing protein [Chitinophaga polysaccharea]|uniref:DUF4397 domain-containing protein n=1 Tax=Chitinophaga polysaccharea TaxID=1293035 RepID=UPI0014554D56|nr:DUF4397 domain-containing protein [Chitinophaga polysaccharea]NLR60418.1 DUF4397 domain-containing protein [Chitinophaga polysaccharea]
MKNYLCQAGALTLLSVSACKKTDYLDVNAGDRPPLSANIRFVNARQQSTGIWFWTFTTKITTDALVPGATSPYLPTTYGNVQINFTEGNSATYKVSRQFGNSASYSATGGPNGPIAGYYHTVFAAPAGSNATKDTLILFYDDLSAPPPGKAKLRLVHLAYGVAPVSVTLQQGSNSNTLYTAIPYGSAGGSNLQGAAYDSAPFTNVNAGTISLVLRTAEGATPLAVNQQALTNITLEAGAVYTLFIWSDNKGTIYGTTIKATGV